MTSTDCSEQKGNQDLTKMRKAPFEGCNCNLSTASAPQRLSLASGTAMQKGNIFSLKELMG